MLTRKQSRRLTARVLRGVGFAGPATMMLTFAVLRQLNFLPAELLLSLASPFAALVGSALIHPDYETRGGRIEAFISSVVMAVVSSFLLIPLWMLVAEVASNPRSPEE